MSSRNIDDLHPDMQPLCREFLARCNSHALGVRISCTYRSNEEQDAEYAKGRTAPGNKVTNAKAGESKHNFTIDGKPSSKAFDIYITNKDGTLNWDSTSLPWQMAGEIGEQLKLSWGGRWKKIKDYPHFEIE